MDLFISYAHEEAAFVERLRAALLARGKEPWIDTEGIEPADRWRGSAQEAIERSDAFVFVLSRAALASEPCRGELDHALSVGKRLIVLCVEEAAGEGAVPEAVAELSWIMMRPEDDFDRGVQRLVHALDTDLEIARVHTRILVRARAWELAGRRASPLLRGDELAAAEDWLSRATIGGGVAPTELQREFIVASRRATTRRQRAIAGISAIVATVAVALSIFALIQRSDAIDNQHIAQSRLLAAEAEANVSSDASLSTLLALEALRVHYTIQAEQALRDALANLQVLLTLRGHTSAVSDAVYSPDGKLIATSSTDGTVRVYDARTGAQRLILHASTSQVAFSPDGARIATSAQPRAGAVIWDVRTGKELLRVGGRGTFAGSLAFSADGSRILLGDPEGTARVFDARSGALQLTIAGSGNIMSAAFNPDGSRIVLARGTSGTASVYDAHTGTQRLVLRGTAFLDAGFSPDGARIVTAGNPTAIWDAGTGRELAELIDPNFGPAFANTASFDSTGTEIVTGSGQPEIWDGRTGRQLNVLGNLATGKVATAAFSPDATRVVTGDLDHYARVWDARAGSQLLDVASSLKRTLVAATLSSDGTKLATLWDRGALPRDTGTVQILDAGTGTPLSQFQVPGSLQGGLTYSSDASRIMTSTGSGPLHVWDARTGRQLFAIGARYSVLDSGAFSADGSRIITVGQDDAIWDARTGRRILNLQSAGLQSAQAAQFSTDGARFVTAGLDGSVRIYDARTARQLLVLAGNTSSVNGASFSTDGSRVVSAGADGTARVWDARTGRQLLVLQGHTGPVDSAAFSRDGSLIATGGDDGTLRIWNAHTGTQLLVLRGDPNPVKYVEFTPRGSEVLSVSSHARVWSTRLAAPVSALERLARSLVTRPFTAQERAEYLSGIGG